LVAHSLRSLLDVIHDALPVRLRAKWLTSGGASASNGGHIARLDAGGEQLDVGQIWRDQKFPDYLGSVTALPDSWIHHV
jgi:hypothetical protein